MRTRGWAQACTTVLLGSGAALAIAATPTPLSSLSSSPSAASAKAGFVPSWTSSSPRSSAGTRTQPATEATADASPEAGDLARRIARTGDAAGRPYAVVDKRAARMVVYDAGGRVAGSTPVLLGAQAGDVSPPGLAGRAPASLRPHERVTPAGRFESEPGHNDRGEAIVWIDYETALAIHRLRPSPARERRAARLASPLPAEHRISLGCIVVPVAFYEGVVAPLLGRQRGVVYVLSETGAAPPLSGAGRWD